MTSAEIQALSTEKLVAVMADRWEQLRESRSALSTYETNAQEARDCVRTLEGEIAAMLSELKVR